MLDKILCYFGWCRSCRPYDTAEGIGGKCENCGRIHGWVTRKELRAYIEREERFAAQCSGVFHRSDIEL